MAKEYTFVDLFSGAGGFTEGFLLAGDGKHEFRLVGASDIHTGAGATHFNRFNGRLGVDYRFLVQDIRSEDFLEKLIANIENSSGRQDVDVVVGGPPCQGFSVFGKRDEQDPRNNLFKYYLGVIEAIRPKYFVMENVPGLVTMYEGKAVRGIYEEVEKIGPVKYHISGPVYVNAVDFGVPQARDRVLFIGSREDCPRITDISKPTNLPIITTSEALDDLSFLNSWEKASSYHPDYPAKSIYQKESRKGRLFKKFGIKHDGLELKNHEAAKHTPDVIARFAMIQPGCGFESIPKELWEKYLSSNKKWCIRMHPDRPSNTVVTLPDDFIHYSKPRIPTAREMARLQSFDDTFEFLGPRTTGGGGAGNKNRAKDLPQYTQIGNAVPPLLAKGIAETILGTIKGIK
ncbi:DNA cytosine methyltransferase [Pseudomonas sp. NY15367]